MTVGGNTSGNATAASNVGRALDVDRANHQAIGVLTGIRKNVVDVASKMVSQIVSMSSITVFPPHLELCIHLVK